MFCGVSHMGVKARKTKAYPLFYIDISQIQVQDQGQEEDIGLILLKVAMIATLLGWQLP